MEAILLRCVNCGAPLPKPEDEYVTCPYCNYTQRIMEAQKYLEQLRGEIYSWISSMIPKMPSTQTMDPIARHHLFTYSIKPVLNPQYQAIKMKYLEIATQPLIKMPKIKIHRGLEDPKEVFKIAAKAEGVTQLAVAEEDINYINQVMGTINGYAHTLNALKIRAEEVGYDTLAKNYEAAAEAFNKAGMTVEAMRMEALAQAAKAINQLYAGNPQAAESQLKVALNKLKEVRREALKKPESAAMIPAIIKEENLLKAMISLTQSINALWQAGKQVGEGLRKFEAILEIAEKARENLSYQPNLRPYATKIERYHEILEEIRKIVDAKTGRGTINAIPGEGNSLIPFWEIEFTYTFTTGIFLAKKGKIAYNTLLVPATFPLNLTQARVQDLLTDILAVRPDTPIRAKIFGEETTLTALNLTALTQYTRPSSILAATNTIPPLATGMEADQLAELYLNQSGKVKFEATKPKRLLYIPAFIDQSGISIPALEKITPRILPNPSTLMRISL